MLLIILFIILLVLGGFTVAGFMGAPWVPTYKNDIEAILDDLGIKNKELYIEFGCGDGRLVSSASKRAAMAIGIEINPLMWLVASLRNVRNKNAQIILGNVWSTPIGNADCVFVFLMPKFMPKLELKLQKELKPSARLASYIYQLPTKKALKKGLRWYIYKF